MPSALARKPSSAEFEAYRAMLALAGFRQIKQTTITVTTANTTYTVTEPGTRRVVVIHGAAAYGDIRFNFQAAATSSSIPVLSQRYFTVDAEKDQVLNFIGVPASTVMNIMEID